MQVPSHINVRDGHDHAGQQRPHDPRAAHRRRTWRRSCRSRHRLLPLLQAVWYIPAGLDIWNQLLGKYPGRYATMKGMNVPPPSYGPVVWNRDAAADRAGGSGRRAAARAHDRDHERRRAAQLRPLPRPGQPTSASARCCATSCCSSGLIDLQDTIIGRKARNTGHKALRARAVVDLADVHRLGPSARRATTSGVPDMAVGPLYYSLYDAACVTVAAEFPDAGKTPQADQSRRRSRRPRSRRWSAAHRTADAQTVWSLLTAHLRNGRSLRSLGDTIQIGAAELILRTTVPRQFTDGQHPFDYCNAANYWMRTSDSPYQPRGALPDGQLRQRRRPLQQAPHLGARARVRRLRRRRPRAAGAAAGAGRGHPGATTCPRTTAVANAYLTSGADRTALTCRRSRSTACKFQDDPAQPEDHALDVRGVRPQLDAPARPPAARDRRGCWPAGRRCRASATATRASPRTGSTTNAPPGRRAWRGSSSVSPGCSRSGGPSA